MEEIIENWEGNTVFCYYSCIKILSHCGIKISQINCFCRNLYLIIFVILGGTVFFIPIQFFKNSAFYILERDF